MHYIILYGLAKKLVRFFSIILSQSSKGVKNTEGRVSCNSLLTLWLACLCGCQAFRYTISFLYACVFSPVWLFLALWPVGFSAHGIFQARILEWIAVSSSRASLPSRDWSRGSCSSCTGSGFFTTESPGKPFLYDLWGKLIIQPLFLSYDPNESYSFFISLKLLETLSQCVAQLYRLYSVTFL